VKRVVNANAYELELPVSLKIHRVINIKYLRGEYRDGVQAFPDRSGMLSPDRNRNRRQRRTGKWLVHRLLDHRKVKRGARHIDQYRSSGRATPTSEATWEPIENLTGSMQLVAKFNRHATCSSVQPTILARTFAQVARSPTRAGSLS
jgi:hypothetical protein